MIFVLFLDQKKLFGKRHRLYSLFKEREVVS